jgi:hypothetical protein
MAWDNFQVISGLTNVKLDKEYSWSHLTLPSATRGVLVLIICGAVVTQLRSQTSLLN